MMTPVENGLLLGKRVFDESNFSAREQGEVEGCLWLHFKKHDYS